MANETVIQEWVNGLCNEIQETVTNEAHLRPMKLRTLSRTCFAERCSGCCFMNSLHSSIAAGFPDEMWRLK